MGFPHELSDLIYPDIGQYRQPQFAAEIDDTWRNQGIVWLSSPSQADLLSQDGYLQDLVTGFRAPSFDGNNYFVEAIGKEGAFYKIGGPGAYPPAIKYTGPNALLHGAKEYTLCVSVPFDPAATSSQSIYFRVDTQHSLDIFSFTSTTLTWGTDWAGAWNGSSTVTATDLKAGDIVNMVACVNQSGARFFCNGKLLGTKSGSGFTISSAATPTFIKNSGYLGAVQFVAFKKALPDSLARVLSENVYRVFKAPSLGYFVPPAAGGSNLAASASGSDTTGGAANLSAAVALSAVGVSVAGGSAALKASIPLSAAGISIASGSAGGGVTVSITAAGLAQSAGSAGLSVAVLLAAAGAAYASGNAVLGARLQAIATGGASASGSATLSGGAIGSISAAGLAQAAGSATLAASVYLAGIGAATAAGNATLAAQLNALATGAAQAGGSANLTGGAPGALSASGSASAGGSAALSINVQLAATGSSQASGAANGSASAPGALSASGQANASGSATWSTLVTLTAAGFVQAMGAGAFTVTVPLSAAGHAQAGGTAHAVLLGTVLNFYLRPSVMRLATLDCSGRRLTTLLHEVLHA